MIELRHLRYFRVVAEEQNFHRAAERISVDLSALSRAVRELEEHVGVFRFSRGLQLVWGDSLQASSLEGFFVSYRLLSCGKWMHG
jgi:hypothetical protein